MSPSSEKKRAHVREQVDAGHAAQRRQQRRRAAAEDAHPDPGRPDQRLQRAALEERVEPLRGLEEVERVARRRCVEHQQVELVLLVEVVELRDRGELLGARDGGRKLSVDAVGLDLLGPRGIGRDPLDQLVERSLRVEHHRPQLAARARARRGEPLGLDPVWLVRELVDAERVGQSLGGIDRDDRDLGALGRHPQGDRRRGRRLADASGSGADADPLAVEQLGDAHGAPPASALRERVRQDLDLARAELLGEHVRKLGQPPVDAGPQARRTARAGSRPGRARRAPRAALSATAASGVRSSAAASCVDLAVVEADRIEPVQHDEVDRSCSPSSVSHSVSVSLTGISSGVATATTPGEARSAIVSAIVRPWCAIGPTRAMLGERPRRPQEADAVAGGRRVDDHEVVGSWRRRCGARAGRAPTPCRSRAAPASPAWPSRTPGTAGSRPSA